jgi:hypothetical protein
MRAVVGHFGESVDDQIDSFVGNQARHGYVVVFLLFLHAETFHLDGWVDHQCRTAVSAPDSLTDMMGYPHEQINVVGGLAVPQTQAMKYPSCEQPLHAPFQLVVGEILMVQVPCIAHGRVDIAQVKLLRGREHAFCKRV